MACEALPLRLLANVFVLSRTTARVFASGEVPGVAISPSLVEVVEREAAAADKGRGYFVELAARQVAVARGLGYAGAYIGGNSKATEIERIIELGDSFAPGDWRRFMKTDSWPVPGAFRLYGTDASTGLANEERQPLGRPKRVPLAYRTDRVIHRMAFKPGTAGFRAAGRLYAVAERMHLGHALHVAEQAVKIPLFDCRDCGDCSLPEIAYLCPENQCVKNQRNGPCGGSRDGECEIPGKACIWSRAYERLKPYGEAQSMLDRPPTIPDHALRRTSAWANTYLGRDHAGRPPAEGPEGG